MGCCGSAKMRKTSHRKRSSKRIATFAGCATGQLSRVAGSADVAARTRSPAHEPPACTSRHRAWPSCADSHRARSRHCQRASRTMSGSAIDALPEKLRLPLVLSGIEGHDIRGSLTPARVARRHREVTPVSRARTNEREPEMDDLDLDRELQATFAVNPSPEFVARVRTTIAETPSPVDPARLAEAGGSDCMRGSGGDCRAVAAGRDASAGSRGVRRLPQTCRRCPQSRLG